MATLPKTNQTNTSTQLSPGSLQLPPTCEYQVGVALKPKTGLDAIMSFVEQVDMVLIMTVEPGFSGQSFMEDQMAKVNTRSQHREASFFLSQSISTKETPATISSDL